MNFDTIPIGPFLISIGGVILLIGILIATGLLMNTARNKELSISFLSHNLFWLLLFSLFVGRAGMFITTYPRFQELIVDTGFFEKIFIFLKYFFVFWDGGFDYTWLTIGFMMALIIIAVFQKQPILKWLDAFVLPGLLVVIFVHIGGFFSSWGYGKPVGASFPKWLSISYNLPSVRYAGDLHPVQIYGVIIFGAIFYVGLKLWQQSYYRRRHWKDGTYFAIMALASSLANIVLEFFRGNAVEVVFGFIRLPQFLSLILALSALIFLIIHTHEKKITTPAENTENQEGQETSNPEENV